MIKTMKIPMKQGFELVYAYLEALDEYVSRAFSVSQILWLGAITTAIVLIWPYDRERGGSSNTETVLHSIAQEATSSNIPLEERKKLCKSSEECRILAEAVVMEARSEPEIGQVAVAHVIMNRVKAPRWGDSVRDVVYQYKQFSYTLEKQATSPSPKDWRKAYLVAYEVLHGLVGDPTGGARYYHTTAISPYWAGSVEYTTTIQNHIFYR